MLLLLWMIEQDLFIIPEEIGAFTSYPKLWSIWSREHIIQRRRDFPNLLCKLQPIFADKRMEVKRLRNGYARATNQGRDRDGGRERSSSNSGHQQLVGGEVVMGRKIRRNLGASPPAGAMGPADLWPVRLPGSLKLHFPPSFFPGDHWVLSWGWGPGLQAAEVTIPHRDGPTVSKSRVPNPWDPLPMVFTTSQACHLHRDCVLGKMNQMTGFQQAAPCPSMTIRVCCKASSHLFPNLLDKSIVWFHPQLCPAARRSPWLTPPTHLLGSLGPLLWLAILSYFYRRSGLIDI